MKRPGLVVIVVLLLLLLLLLYAQRASLAQQLFALTGEESAVAQLRAVGHLLTDLIRPPLDLQAETPIAHNGVNPYGINTFLQQEVEPAKRARQVRLIAAAGFHWLRQEFPWADLEISAKGNFDDCRNPPGCVSAWAKYDEIVTLTEQFGLELLVRLSSPPAWSRAVGHDLGAFAPPDHVADFADYAAAVATRYQGRLRYYQVWNEPNIYNEWGNQPVDPEGYTALLCATYAALKQVDPAIVVVSGVLAPTAELGAANEAGGNNLNDYVYLQRMYAAGAQPCFDVLSVQGYGLWSGPGDHRRRPLIVNFGRNQFIRDLMVANGDAHKAIWIAEMNWNVVPNEPSFAANFGRVTVAQQARYAPLAYQRAQAEWPWVGMTAFWFFKRADDSNLGQDWYYFRMAEPDFTLLPVYQTMSDYMHQPPVMYRGWFQEDHWAVTWGAGWEAVTDPAAVLGAARTAQQSGARLSFTFDGTDLLLSTQRGPAAGNVSVKIDDGPAAVFDLHTNAAAAPAQIALATGLTAGPHSVVITSLSGANVVDGFIVRAVPARTGPILLALGALLLGVWLFVRRKPASAHA